jgi:hypothetical protein
MKCALQWNFSRPACSDAFGGEQSAVRTSLALDADFEVRKTHQRSGSDAQPFIASERLLTSNIVWSKSL